MPTSNLWKQIQPTNIKHSHRWATGGGSYQKVIFPAPALEDAHLEITIFYSDQEPIGPYKVSVPARRTKHVRFNDLTDPQPIPRDRDYASVIESNVAVVVQHTRLDSRQAENALMTTMAFADTETVMMK